MIKRTTIWLVLFASLFSLLCTPVLATETDTTPPSDTAGQVPSRQVELQISGTGYEFFSFLTNGESLYYFTSKGGCTLNVTSPEAFNSLYLMFDLECGEYTVTDDATGESVTAGQYGFLHEYISLPFSTNAVTISFPGDVSLGEISAYTGGTPTDIQIWQPPLEGETDLLLLSAHGDDEQLFFAGLLPLYAGELDYNVQVAYLTDHRTLTMERTHEMLNGLWSVGVTAYPVFGSFHDFRKDSLDLTYYVYNARGVSNEMLLGFVVEQLRRFDPQVVVTHDFAGEYGHGMHQLYADLLVKALEVSNDTSAYPELAEKYGVWDVPKAYIHLYEENPVVMDYDQPLEAFNGMTAFEVTQKLGFPCHVSQVEGTNFGIWLYGENGEITKASQITTFNPSYFGLYRSTVGEDVLKNDLMENTVTFNERKRLKEEALAKEEADRLESERLEAERLAQEEAERKAEEEKRLDEKRLKEEAAAKAEDQRRMMIFITAISAVVLLLVIGSVLPRMLQRKPTDDSPTKEK